MNSSPTRSKNLFRERSISSLPSRQLSVMALIGEKESTIRQEEMQLQREQSLIIGKEHEISKLRRNLQTAVQAATSEKLILSKTKEEVMSHTYQLQYLKDKLAAAEREIVTERQKRIQDKGHVQELENSIEVLRQANRDLENSLNITKEKLEMTKAYPQEIEALKIKLKDLQPLKGRIMVLQEQVRGEKKKRGQAEQKLKERQKEKEQLVKLLATSKPREQQLRQRIAYFERVNLDLERKMEDYNRRENDYIKQIGALKMNLTRVTADRNHFKTVYEETTIQLQASRAHCQKLQDELIKQKATIRDLQQRLSEEQAIVASLKEDLQGKISYYKKQGEENAFLKERNRLLQVHQLEQRKVLEGYIRVADEVNLTIVSRTEEIRRLNGLLEALTAQLRQCQEKYEKFDKLMEQGSQKSYNQIREGFYVYVRNNNELAIQARQAKATLDQKLMVMGEKRDAEQREAEIRSGPIPTDETQYASIFYQKTQCIVLVEKSNDQLLKVKKDLEGQIQALQAEVEKERKEMVLLKLKTADLIRAKKDLEDARKNNLRYQQMIEEQKETIRDTQSQVAALRQRTVELNDRHFRLELEKKNIEVEFTELKAVMKELDLQVLMASKQANEKNAHLLTDSLQKFESAIKSLAFFFSCAFCGEIPATPVTLALCGHTYCTKCKEAYSESCYECDTGQPIEKVFPNKFLKDATGKYKFLTMVVSQLKAHFVHKS